MIELLEHNKETYKELCKVLEENNKCALVQATGTGKSYIAGKYIEEHAKSALILVPTNAIADAWKELFHSESDAINIITYQAFAKEPDNYLEYDLVIADEMHHLGSDVWGKKFVETYLQSENHKIIGLTATEIRYLDNSRDMAEEIFDNIRVDGCDLQTAINTGVLPTFKYVSALYCNESDFDEWREKAGKIKDIKTQAELKGRLDVCIKNMVSVKQAVNENLTDDYKKIIVFLNNVESKETALGMFKDVFPTANFYDVDYGKSRAENNLQIDKFKSDSDRAVLFVVDMLNEGIHIKGTDCIIMFRKTVSPQVYLQQLGRGLASGTDKMPVIFDFVSNTENINRKLGSESGQGIIRTWNDSIEDDKKILVKSYCLEIEDLFLKISGLTEVRAWTDEEEKYIYEHYQIKNMDEMARELDRTKNSVRYKMIRMGLYSSTQTRRLWTSEEEEYIYENYKTKNINEIAKELDRDKETLKEKMKRMGLFKPVIKRLWTAEEEKYIYENYKFKCINEMSKTLQRNPSSVIEKMKRMGIYIKKQKKWTEEEELFLKNNKDNMTIKEIAEKLGRPYGSVSIKIGAFQKNKQKHKKWSYVEDKFIFDNYKSMSREDLAINLGRSKGSVRSRVKILGLSKPKGALWTKEEDDYIKNNCEKKTIGDIAIELGRTKRSVQARASKLKIIFLKKRSVVQLKISGEYIATYESLYEAARCIQKKRENIGLCVRKISKTAYGYKWMYEEDYKKMIAEKEKAEMEAGEQDAN